MNLAVPDYINVCQCLIFLDDAQAVADILSKLLKENEVSQPLLSLRVPKESPTPWSNTQNTVKLKKV